MPSLATLGNDLYSGRRSIDFIGRRRTWYLIAVIAMVISILGLGVRHLNLGIEFRGGSEFRVSKATTLNEAVGVNAVHQVLPGAEVHVSTVGSDGVRVQTDKLTDAQVAQVQKAVAKAYGVRADEVSTSFVGPTWGQDVSRKALQGLVVFLIAVALVIALYFRTWKMALAAIVALVHDLILTAGVYAIVGFEVTPASVIGFLTILGYSLYDTVVVFDKVRENTEHITSSTKRTYAEAANLAINQTLVRSINTSVVALLPVASILFIGAVLLGAGTLKDISLALLVGIAAGTYSSIFIAVPLLVQLREGEPELVAQAERVRKKRAAAAAGGPDRPADSDADAETDGEGTLAAVGAGPLARGSGETGVDAATPSGDAAKPAGPATPAASPAAGAEPGRRPGSGGQRQQPRRGGSAGGRGRPGGRKR